MATEKYGTTQVKEVRFSQGEVEAIVADYVRAKNIDNYDFDGNNMSIIRPTNGNGLIIRMFQKEFTTQENPRDLTLTKIKNDNDKDKSKEQKILVGYD